MELHRVQRKPYIHKVSISTSSHSLVFHQRETESRKSKNYSQLSENHLAERKAEKFLASFKYLSGWVKSWAHLFAIRIMGIKVFPIQPSVPSSVSPRYKYMQKWNENVKNFAAEILSPLSWCDLHFAPQSNCNQNSWVGRDEGALS